MFVKFIDKNFRTAQIARALSYLEENHFVHGRVTTEKVRQSCSLTGFIDMKLMMTGDDFQK